MKTGKTLIYLLILLTIITTSCKKDKANEKLFENQLSASDLKFSKMMHSFNARIKSNLKSGETMAIDSAVWYLESSLNFDYSRSNSSIAMRSSDSTEVIIPISENGELDFNSIATAKEQFIIKLHEQYERLSGDKEVLVIDLVPEIENANELTLKMSSTMGVSGPINMSSFGVNDNWMWGNGQGKCDDPSYAPWDAALKIAQYANRSIGIPSGEYTVTGVVTRNIYPPDTPSVPNPFGFGPYLLFSDGGYGNIPDNPCFNQTVMNYYLNGIKTIAVLFKPASKSIISFECYSDHLVPNNSWNIIHAATIRYGIYIMVADPPAEL